MNAKEANEIKLNANYLEVSRLKNRINAQILETAVLGLDYVTTKVFLPYKRIANFS